MRDDDAIGFWRFLLRQRLLLVLGMIMKQSPSAGWIVVFDMVFRRAAWSARPSTC